MNANEAKEQALWWHLPTTLRNKIETAIAQGDLEVEYYSDKISSNTINDIYNTLKELGYSVVIGNDNNVLWICWGCYQWLTSESDER